MNNENKSFRCFDCIHYTDYMDGGIIKQDKITKLTHIRCDLKCKQLVGPIGYNELTAHKWNWKNYIILENCPLDKLEKQLSLFDY